MLRIHKLYVGLSKKDQPDKINRAQVISTVAKHFDSFTVHDAQGFYKGDQENTLVLTIAHKSHKDITEIAHQLCLSLKQDAIGLEFGNTYYRITKDHFVLPDVSIHEINSLVNNDVRERLS
jgi:hypothetical protein